MSTTGAGSTALDDLLTRVSAGRMTATVAALAGDRFTGRRVGTAGNAAAREWLADGLRADGAIVTTEPFTVAAVPEIYREPVARWRHGRSVTGLTFGRDVAVHLASADLPDVREGLLGVAGRGDPAGRWLLVPAGMTLFDAYGHAFRAAGLLLPRGVDADGWQYTMLAGPHPGPLPILTLETHLHRRMLADHDGDRFLADAPIRRTDVTGANLSARYRSGDLEVLLTAHLDGVGDHPGLRQPSAADNGSGVAVVREAALLLAPALPAGIGLSVALIDGEEVGAVGSAHHARRLRDAGAAPLVLNVDGAGRLDGAVAVEAGGPAHGLVAVLDQAGRHTGVPLVAGPVASDNRRYAAAGLAAVGLGAGMAGYHSPADTPDHVDPATMTALTRLVVATVWLAANNDRCLRDARSAADAVVGPSGHAARTSDEAGRKEPEMTTSSNDLPVVVIGAGPVGLAAAAHLTERGIPYTVLEAGDGPAAAVRRWGHVRLFSPWRFDTDAAARRLLSGAGWVEPDPDVLPTGDDLVEGYLRPLADLPAVRPHVRYGARVVAVTRFGLDRLRSANGTAGRDATPFLVRLDTGEDVLARAVVDASGTWSTPNVLGASGIPAHGESTVPVESALPDVLGRDRDRFAGRRTVVVGAGHSAANTLLALADLAAQVPGTTVTWAIRSTSPARAYGGGSADALPARGALGTRLREHVEAGTVTLVTGFPVQRITRTADGVELTDGRRTVTADRIVSATGFRPDHTIAAELRLDLDPVMGSTRALAPLIDPNEHSCGTVPPHGADELAHPEPGYYAVGVKSYGRAPTFLLATGYEQVRSVVAALAGDWEAARDVRLDLPETGVCNSNPALGSTTIDGDDGCDTPAARPARVGAGLGLATGIRGGLLAAPLTLAPAAPSLPENSGGCCGG